MSQPTAKMRLGIDLGNVVIGGEGEDTSFFSDNFLNTPVIPGAFEAIAALAQTWDIWIISKCGQRIQDRSLEWLEAKGFFDITGVSREQVIFCRKRNQKAGIAADLGLKVFIDDRTDIINSMQGIVPQPILFTSWAQVQVRPVSTF